MDFDIYENLLESDTFEEDFKYLKNKVIIDNDDFDTNIVIKSNSSKFKQEEEEEESFYNENVNNDSKADDDDQNKTKSTCVEFEYKDILDESFFPDIDSINYNNHYDLLFDLDEDNHIHHLGVECNCELNIITHNNQNLASVETTSSKYDSSCSTNYLTNSSLLESNLSLRSNEGSIYESYLRKKLNKIKKDKKTFYTTNNNVYKFNYNYGISNIFDYSLTLLHYLYNKMWQSKSHLGILFITFNQLYSSFINCKIDYRPGIVEKNKSLPEYNKSTTSKIFQISKIDKKWSKESNIRKKLKTLFNKKVTELINILLIVISSCKFKTFTNINHTDPHKKNNILLFNQTLKAIFSMNKIEKQTIEKLYNREQIIKSLLMLNDEILSEKIIFLEIIRGILNTNYGKMLSLFYSSNLFQNREKNQMSLGLEEIFEELGRKFYTFIGE